MEEIKKPRTCAICGSGEYDIVYYFPPDYYNHDKFITHSWDGEQSVALQIVKCKGCGLIYQNPCITEAGMQYIYPESIIPDKLDYTQLMTNHKFHHLIDTVMKYYPDAGTQHPSVLDVGTRFGVLPELFSKKGFTALGIEYNKKCVEAAHASGFKLISQGTINDLKQISASKNKDRYNVVVMTDVIEHLLEPLKDIQAIAEFQKSGDRFFISTMNVDSIGHKMFGKEWYYIHSQHTFYFNKKSLQLMFDKAGYDIEWVFQIPAYKSLRIFAGEYRKYRKHKTERNSPPVAGSAKTWFADNRPQLFDLFTLVFKKR